MMRGLAFWMLGEKAGMALNKVCLTSYSSWKMARNSKALYYKSMSTWSARFWNNMTAELSRDSYLLPNLPRPFNINPLVLLSLY